MSELSDLILTEKYRPSTFDDLILENKDSVIKYIDNPKTLPSFIFYSTKPGTGKTSCAKVIIKALDCDYLSINSSDERGIDTIREKVTRFAMGLSSNMSKRCVFLDEADGLTSQAQNSLRNLMETYSDNCFFIFSCNDINKIIEPIRSRCTEVNFETPSKQDILFKLCAIVVSEEIKEPHQGFLAELIDNFYPDIRSMVSHLQHLKLTGINPINTTEDFEMFLDALERKDIDYIIQATYASNFDVMAWNKWYFKKVFDTAEKLGLEKCISISDLIADTEKHWNMGANLEIVFLANIFKLMRVL